jgi:hypothetical protein
MKPPKYIASQVPDENGESIILEGNSIKEIREEINSFPAETFHIYKLMKL